MTPIHDLLSAIEPVDRSLEPDIRARLDNLTKPRGSLGRLEEIALRYALARGAVRPAWGSKVIVTFAADHGVVEEGVSAYPKAVTPQMVLNMLAGGAAVNALARHAGAELRVVDVGVDFDFGPRPGLFDRKVRRGTRNLAREPAMTAEETLRAIGVGADLARGAARDGAALIGTGEMGIGNTTPSAALFSALLPCPVDAAVGRGTGVDDAGLARKTDVVRRALARHRDRLHDPLEALACVGGLEIAAIAGLILGAAAERVPTVVDGFISSAAALVACRLCPAAQDYLFFSHCSHEAGHRTFFRLFRTEPLLDLGMRLGEGTGAALAMSIVEAAMRCYDGMATFDSARVSGRSGGDGAPP